ncbi:hypothetical protein LguiA_001580 [Lonicera macranthoides]
MEYQKNSEHDDDDGIEPLNTPTKPNELPKLSELKIGTLWEPVPEEEDNNRTAQQQEENTPQELLDIDESSRDLLEAQRQYYSIVHSIQEKVTEQPSMLQGGELSTYQLEGLQWLLSLFNNNLNGILADEKGLGKRIQTIALIAYLMENKDVIGPYLIVAPKAVLPNWMNKFSQWAPRYLSKILQTLRILHLPPSSINYSYWMYWYVLRTYNSLMHPIWLSDERKVIREEYLGEEKFNVLITHYDLIMRDKRHLKKIHWSYVVVDEGIRLKNHESALAQALVSGYQFKRRLLLAGMPIPNNLQELWVLLKFLLPDTFNSVKNFEEWFNAPFSDQCDVSLTDEQELLIIHRLQRVIRPFILRRKKDEVGKRLKFEAVSSPDKKIKKKTRSKLVSLISSSAGNLNLKSVL